LWWLRHNTEIYADRLGGGPWQTCWRYTRKEAVGRKSVRSRSLKPICVNLSKSVEK
jgi:hypothetical protein